MSKFVRTAAEIIGAVVAIAAAIPSGGTSLLAYELGVSATVAAEIAIATTVAVAGIEALTAPKPPSAAGAPTSWQADPDAGIDIVFGDAFNAGKILYRQTYGKTNKYETIFTHWSLGPVAGIDTLYVDQVAKTVSGGIVNIDDRGKMYEVRQRGLCPEASAMTVGPVQPYGWTAQHKLSGKAATGVTFVYDQKGGHTFTSIPGCGWRGRGVLCYDPRKDDTYPGGSGPQRIGDQSTWAFSRNPYIGGLTWIIGWRQNGKLVAGVGQTSGILIDQFVEGANVADANGWTFGGVKSTIDDKWVVLKDILQAGGGEPIQLGAQVGCFVNTPRVRLATITRDDLAQGDIVVPGMTRRKDRINAISPRYMGETQVTAQDSTGTSVTSTTWGTVTGAPIIVADYVTADGRQRRKQADYPMVQCFAGTQPAQVAQLARYDIENAREIDGIQLPLKLRWIGYRPGDCVGVHLPEGALADQDVVIRSRGIAPATGVITMTCRTETADKHPFALGQTTTPPPSPSLSAYSPAVDAPAAGSWAVAGSTVSSAGGSLPALIVTGAVDNDVADGVIFEIRDHVDGQADDAGWRAVSLDAPNVTTKTIGSVAAGSEYDVAVSYRVRGVIGGRLILDPATAGVLSTAGSLQQAVFGSWIVEVSAGLQVVTAAADGTITIANHTRRYPDGHPDVAVIGGTIASGLAHGDATSIGYDDPGRTGGAVTYVLYADDNDAHASAANPGRHYMGYAYIPVTGTGGGGGGGIVGGRGNPHTYEP